MPTRFDYGVNLNELTAEERKEGRSEGALFSNLERRLENKEPLTGKTLELAIKIVTPDPLCEDKEFNETCCVILEKFKNGEPLEHKELTLFLDILVVHHQL